MKISRASANCSRNSSNAKNSPNDAPADGSTAEVARSQEVFKLPLGTTGVVTARITSPKDAFPLDDQAQVVVGNTEGTKVLLVTKGNYFLEKAFVSHRGVEVTKMAPDDFLKEWGARGPAAVEGYDASIFESVAPSQWPDGGAVFLGALPPLPGFAMKENPKLEWPRILDWDVAHPVMRYVNFGNIQVAKAQAWSVPKTAHPLVETAGAPLIAAVETDRVHAVGVDESMKPYWSKLIRFRPVIRTPGAPHFTPCCPAAKKIAPAGVQDPNAGLGRTT